MNFSEETNHLLPALLEARKKMLHPKRDTENPFTKSWYATLYDVIHGSEGPLFEHGLMVVQESVRVDDGSDPMIFRMKTRTRIIHCKSGQFVELDFDTHIPPDKTKIGTKTDPDYVLIPPSQHKIAGSQTYSRRYGLKGALFLAETDEDQNGNETLDSEGAQALDPGITPNQIGELDVLMEKGNVEVGKFLAYLGVDYIQDLPQSRFKEARAALKNKIAVEKEKKERDNVVEIT